MNTFGCSGDGPDGHLGQNQRRLQSPSEQENLQFDEITPDVWGKRVGLDADVGVLGPDWTVSRPDSEPG